MYINVPVVFMGLRGFEPRPPTPEAGIITKLDYSPLICNIIVIFIFFKILIKSMKKYETNPYDDGNTPVYRANRDYWSSIRNFSQEPVAGASSVYLPQKARYERSEKMELPKKEPITLKPI